MNNSSIILFAVPVVVAVAGLASIQGEMRDQVVAMQAESQRLEAELQTARDALDQQSDAFQELVVSHEQLQERHRASMDWGPLRAPRDCVREVILLDESAWPYDRDGNLAYISDHCLDMCAVRPPPRESAGGGDANSSWITWPEGHVIDPFPNHGLP